MGLTISQLSAVTALATGDQIVVWSSSNGDTRKASLTTLLSFFEAQFAAPGFETQTNAPTSSGFNLQLTASTESIWAVVNPTAAFAAGTITLPPVTDAFDGQQILFTCSEAITALTVAGNGATVTGEPTALGTGGFFSLRFNDAQSTWYCTSQSLGATNVFDTITVTTAINTSDGAAIKGTVSTSAILAFTDTPVAVNHIRIANEATGNSPYFFAEGSDANLDIDIQPKGTGVVRIDGIEAVDLSRAQTLTNKTLTSPQMTGAETDSIVTGGQPSSTVALLNILYPAASNSGGRTVVIDSNAALVAGHGNVVAGGGANVVPVYCDGTNWRIG